MLGVGLEANEQVKDMLLNSEVHLYSEGSKKEIIRLVISNQENH